MARIKRGWLPRQWSERIRYSSPEPMGGGTRSGLTIHNEGVKRRCNGDHDWLAEYVNQKRIPYHAIWCPVCGYWCQMVPFGKAARSMKGGNVDGKGNSANKAGRVNVQICIIGDDGKTDISKKKLKNAWVIAEIIEKKKIKKYIRTGNGRSKKKWMKGGVQGHKNGPDDDHTDPGALDLERLIRKAYRQRKNR